MKNYQLKKEKIIETKTANTIYSGKNVEKIFDKLNSGSGFIGWTPTFFCRKIN